MKIIFAREVGKRVRELRKALPLSQKRLAERADVSESFLSEVENGKRSMSFSKAADIAAALKVTVNDLLPQKQGGVG